MPPPYLFEKIAWKGWALLELHSRLCVVIKWDQNQTFGMHTKKKFPNEHCKIQWGMMGKFCSWWFRDSWEDWWYHKFCLCQEVKMTMCCVFSESQREPAYWSRQSLNTPSPVETELDLLVMRERARRGIRNNGYDVSLTHTHEWQTYPQHNSINTSHCNKHCFTDTSHWTECFNSLN